jgi:iron complex outermembrane receptor protein
MNRHPRLLFFFLLVLLNSGALAQHSFNGRITDEGGSGLPGATVYWKEKEASYIADSLGYFRITNISAGRQRFLISFTGYQNKHIQFLFPLTSDSVIAVLLEKDETEEAEVIVTATRSGRTLDNTPTRLEVISGEELAEKGNMKPGEIRMVLTESTGIQTQQTSATSFNSGIRIQGLEGKYTQLLRDGYPLYSGFSGGLSIMQIAPLDLKQVEVIKGSASTLYGGGAIAGLINLVSRTPEESPVLNFLVNGTSAGGLDINGFYSEKYGRAGLTVFASRSSNAAYDPAGNGLTAIPRFERYTVNPRLFLYGKQTAADIGFSYIKENRLGGSMRYIKEGAPGFFEENNTERVSIQSGVKHQINSSSFLQLKNSYSHFNRSIFLPSYRFHALQQSSFSELTWNLNKENSDWIIGANLLTDQLKEKKAVADSLRDYHYKTLGFFIQHTWTPATRFHVETGLRYDYVKQFGSELLPRISMMYKISSKLTSRLGGGFGYKTPTIFSEESERIHFRNISPVNINTTNNERSIGGNWDINYRGSIGELSVNVNQLFFYTRLRSPLIMIGAPGGKISFQNANGHIDTKGMETNLRFLYGQFKLFVGYTYTDANTHYNEISIALPLNAPHRLNNVLMFEVEDKWKVGLEAYYFSKQLLNDGSYGRPYWITGFMAEKLWEKFSVFINFENFTDTRQSRFDTTFSGSIDNPVFKDIYAPVEGFVVNGGIKLRF